ncbi:hypothetical protein EWM64_g5469 [Hericium alpestre]|uniref:Uncharacterized protein n=1 Tax=Hericium alpestre TaxID=135208 RepID=A0A4Y9ZWZ1_9AGAM|nr:hypothetical protein EWM64_g5469 [Hericium alpestre]
MTAQLKSSVEAAARPTYAFLAHPPQQKKRSNQSIPQVPPTPLHGSATINRRRSSKTLTVAVWAGQVQPGSPAPISPPCSARRSPLYGSPRRASLTRTLRRSSITSQCVPSASFLSLIDTPSAATPSIKDYQPDLHALGYTCSIVPLPSTPQSAVPKLASPPKKKVPKELTIPGASVSPAKTSPKKGALNRLRSRLHSKSQPPSPSRSPSGTKMHMTKAHTKPASKSATKRRRSRSRASLSPGVTAFAIARRKKEKYASYRFDAVPLQNELALMQFIDGGDQEQNIRRLMACQAKAAGDKSVVGDVYRDGRGGVWWDEHEEWEYAHLLGGQKAWSACSPADAHEWVEFTSAMEEESRHSLSTRDSDLDARYAMPAPGLETSADDLATFGDALAPTATCIPGMSVLAIPARSRRTAPHLRKAAFFLDTSAFTIPVSPRSPKSPFRMTSAPRPKGKARRRPAPLTLLPPQTPPAKCPTNSPAVDTGRARADFLGDSFAPAVPVKDVVLPRVQNMDLRTVAKKRSRLNLAVGGLFRAMGGRRN